jgi:radical SAM protein with 4Fe4S-binding SPASM domain
MPPTTNRSPFLIKNLARENRFRFLDRRSDFQAVMDGDGLRKLKNIFELPREELEEPELQIARTLVGRGLAGSFEELVGLGPPLERLGSLLARIEIEVTRRCNLACLHCLAGKAKDDFDLSILERNLAGFEELGVVEVILNGGEIFLHPRIEEILSLLERFKIILFTNGTIEPAVEVIAAASVARVNVSLDGFRESHEHLRGPGTFDRTVTTIRKLVDRGVAVQIGSVIYHQNIGRLEEFIDFCRTELKACGVELSTIYPLGTAKEHPELCEESQDRLHREVYEKYLKKDLPGLPSERHLPCLAGITKLFIGATGTVSPCRLFEGEEFRMGSLEESSMVDLYRRFVDSPSLFTRFRIEELTSCHACTALSTCKTGCRARAWVCHGDVRSPDLFSCRHYLK